MCLLKHNPNCKASYIKTRDSELEGQEETGQYAMNKFTGSIAQKCTDANKLPWYVAIA